MTEGFADQCREAVDAGGDLYRGPRIRIDLAYVGRDFHGWQIQPDRRTVQGELRGALIRLLGREVMPVGAGRTDAGVHARGQVAHLTLETEEECERVARALAGQLPDDMAVRGVRRVSPWFNARASATSRRYSYALRFVRDIFRPHCWQVERALDHRAMDDGAADLVGTHDFTSFCKTSSLKDDGNACAVTLCAFEWREHSAIFHVQANRFLHHMVRIMVGTLIEIGRGERDRRDVPRILAARRRGAAGRMAPPQGLFLEEVTYPDQVLDPSWAPAPASEGDPA